jgi:hypothetical protein
MLDQSCSALTAPETSCYVNSNVDGSNDGASSSSDPAGSFVMSKNKEAITGAIFACSRRCVPLAWMPDAPRLGADVVSLLKK